MTLGRRNASATYRYAYSIRTPVSDLRLLSPVASSNSGRGSEQDQPDQLNGLVLRNYENIGIGEQPGDFHFMRPDSKHGRIVMPCVIGFHGNPQAWVEKEIRVLESNGACVWPESLYNARFKLRMHSTGE